MKFFWALDNNWDFKTFYEEKYMHITSEHLKLGNIIPICNVPKKESFDILDNNKTKKN